MVWDKLSRYLPPLSLREPGSREAPPVSEVVFSWLEGFGGGLGKGRRVGDSFPGRSGFSWDSGSCVHTPLDAVRLPF